MKLSTDKEALAYFKERADWWFEDQTVGLLAFLGRTTDDPDQDTVRRNFNSNAVLRAIRNRLGEISPSVDIAVHQLRLTPPTIDHLYRLTSCIDGWQPDNEEFLDRLARSLELPFEIISAYDINDVSTNAYYKVLRSAQHLSDIILYTSVSASALFRIVEDFGSTQSNRLELTDDASTLARFQELLDLIRPERLKHGKSLRYYDLTDVRHSYQQLVAVCEIESILHSRLPDRLQCDFKTLCAEDVSHCLIQRVFHWVLSVSHSSAKVDQLTGAAAAVSVDTFTNQSSTHECNDVTVTSGCRVDISDWLKPRQRYIPDSDKPVHLNTFEYATRVTKLLWSDRNLRYTSSDVTDQVAFDFSVTDEIATRAFRALGDDSAVLRFVDPSIEVYLCTAVANRLTARESVLNTLASGALGVILSEAPRGSTAVAAESQAVERGYDCEVHGVGSIVEKTGCAALRTVYDKLIVLGLERLPRTEQSSFDRYRLTNRRHRTLAVVKADRLSAIFNSAVSGYSPQSFIRVPELLTGYGAGSSANLHLARRLIEETDSPVVTIDAENLTITAADVFSAVVELEQLSGHSERLVWSAIRTNVFEEDERFWRTLWDVVRAPYRLYLDLIACDDPEIAAQIICEAMNGASGRDASSWLGQDLIVIFGANHLCSKSDFTYQTDLYRLRRDAYRPLNFEAILPHLKRQLSEASERSHCSSPLTSRIILLNEETPEIAGTPFDEATLIDESVESLVYDALSSFQFGFTTGQAIRVCTQTDRKHAHAPAEFEQALRKLRSLGAIVWCEKTSEWFSVNHFGKPRIPVEPKACSRRLNAIADSLSAPHPKISSGTEVVESYRPHVAFERQYYGRLSRMWLPDDGDFKRHIGELGVPQYPKLGSRSDYYGHEIIRWRTKARKLNQTASIVEPLNWRSLETALTFNSHVLKRHVFEGVLELLELRPKGSAPHPKRVWTLGTAALKYLLKLQRLLDGDGQGDQPTNLEWHQNCRNDVLEAVERWMQVASEHEACKQFPEWLISLKTYQQLIMKQAGVEPNWGEACELLSRLRESVKTPKDGFTFIPIGWVDWMADRSEDADAAWLYELGTRNNPTWRIAVLKWIGTANQMGDRTARIAWNFFMEEDRQGRERPLSLIQNVSIRRRPLIEDFSPSTFLNQVQSNAQVSGNVHTRLVVGAKYMRRQYLDVDLYYTGIADVALHALNTLSNDKPAHTTTTPQ